MIRRLLASCVLTACLGVVALANHQATFVLRNGDRVNGELSYKGGASYTLNGRDYPSDDISLIAFVPGDPSAAELRQIPTVDNNPSEHERHVFVTRSGEVIFGKIYNISADGNTFTYDRREGGRQEISSDQLARVYVNPAGARTVYAGVLNAPVPNAAAPNAPVPNAPAPNPAAPDAATRRGRVPAAGAPSGAAPNAPVPDAAAPSGATRRGRMPAGVAPNVAAPSEPITVNANQAWTDTGISVVRGEQISFTTSGQIRIAQGSSRGSSAGPDGSRSGNVSRANQPVPAMAPGGLIARVGSSAPFAIGSNTQPITMPADGRLYLGINDDQVADNSGAFFVSIRR